MFSMVLARIIADWGPTPIAVQKVGSQIESISWMTAGGFSSALTAFVGQNYGAGKLKRVHSGYITTIFIASLLGIFATALLIFGGEQIFAIFIPDKEVLSQGADYLRILGYSQLFMCIEITTAGAFFGMGKTGIPSVVSIVFTGLRIPAAMILSRPDVLGIDGVWWAISLSSVIKGILLVALYIIYVMKPMKKQIELNDVQIS
jgi:Na+-driven multidrug efflux pump